VSIQLLRKRKKQKLEAVKFWRKRKSFYKISWKRKRTRKRPILSGAESGSKNPKSEEVEANSEAWRFKWSWKRKQKIFYCFHIHDLGSNSCFKTSYYKIQGLVWVNILTIREKGHKIYSYQKYLQHKFISKFW